MTYKRFRYITLPRIWWYMSGMFIWDEMYSYWWLNIAKRPPQMSDAMQEGCVFHYCRTCGKGKK